MNDKQVIEAAKTIRDCCQQRENCIGCPLFNLQMACVCEGDDNPEDWDVPDHRPWTIAEQAFARYASEQGYEFIQKKEFRVVTRDENGQLMGYNYTRPGFFDDLQDGDKVSPETVVREGGQFS